MLKKIVCLSVIFLSCLIIQSEAVTVSGDLMQWHRVTLTVDGPSTSEQAIENPFLNYRLTAFFSHESASQKVIAVPGFYAADGNAAETSAQIGNTWKVYFTPPKAGTWFYKVSFIHGDKVAIHPHAAGKSIALENASGSFTIRPTNKQKPDFRAQGLLQYVGKRYLQFAGSKEYFLKGGADSPENFLAYVDFDHVDTLDRSQMEHRQGEAKPKAEPHSYKPHLQDWKPGDPTWQDGKGKAIIGALNYLASEKMNSVYFLTMNVQGDGNDVWPWTEHNERFRFDCSKLAQWEIVFSHMDSLGLMMHVITQETENDQLLDGGNLGDERKLYYRELIARFAHHPALVWNLGEENTNTTAQIKNFSDYIQSLDPYKHPIVIHTYPNQYDKVYGPILAHSTLQGPSLQMGNMKKTHAETIKWIDRSAQTGHQWFVSLDEIGPANTGVKPDKDDPDHKEVRQHPLWGNLMAGGAGCEWYFGYKFAHNDLNCEDWRSRDKMWDYTRYALQFFQKYLPFAEMHHADMLTSSDDDYCFAKEGKVYAIYLPNGGSTSIAIAPGDYSVHWYNPRTGEKLMRGNVKTISGPGMASIGNPPEDEKEDWAVLIRKMK